MGKEGKTDGKTYENNEWFIIFLSIFLFGDLSWNEQETDTHTNE